MSAATPAPRTPQDDAHLRAILRQTRTIAILGASDQPARAGCYVATYLHGQGYDVVGISPRLAGQRFCGRPALASLAALPGPIDLVDVFRRSEELAAHLPELLALRPLPRVVWLQLGVVDEAFAAALESAGVEVVRDRCTLAEHRRLGIGPVPTSPPGSGPSGPER